MVLHQIIMYLYKRFFSIVVIRVDHRKWFPYQFFTAENGLTRPPGLCPSLWLCKTPRQIIQLLECICRLYALLHPFADHFPEVFFQIFPYDKHDFIKPCFHGIMNGIINDNLS